MKTLTSPQNVVAGPQFTKRTKPGAVLSQKERQGQPISSEITHRKPFFAPNKLNQPRLTNSEQSLSAELHSSPLQNPLLNLGNLLLTSPFVAIDQQLYAVDPQGNQPLVDEQTVFMPVAAPAFMEQNQQGGGEMKAPFSSDFRPVAIGPATTNTNIPDAGLPANELVSASPAEPAISPTTPGEDPQFQATLQDVRHTRQTLRKHPNPEKKVAEYTNAAVLPEPAQAKRNASKQHLSTIGDEAATVVQNKQAFTPETFKVLLKNNLTELEGKLPHNESGAKRFKQQKPLETIKQAIGQNIDKASTAQLRSISSEVSRKDPPTSNLPVQTPQGFKPEPTGPKPRPIDPIAATPKPKTDPEISMEAESRSMDDLMAARKMTDQQLADSNEPAFLKTLDAKQQAKDKAAQAPQTYRQVEQQTLGTAQKKASATAQTKVGGMVTTRQQTFLGVFLQQNTTELADKSKQIVIDSQFLAIYDGTKNEVKRILEALSAYVDDTFSRESDDAKKQFEKVVEDKLDDIHGWGVKDFLVGEDTEAIETVFEQEGSKFKRALGTTIDKIAVEIANRLNEAAGCIELGRKRSKDLFDSLDIDQQKLHSDTFSQFKTQFDNLQLSVDDKQAELAQSLAESYKANVDSLRETFDKINEETRKTWIDKAAEFIEEAATAIYRLGKLLLSILSRLANLIGDILAHPIRFLEHLGEGLKLGFSRFADKFDEYLLTGFFDWLRGSVASTGIQMPTSFDGKGLFNLATQLVGLDYATFREVAVEKLGIEVVTALEKGEAWIEEAVEKGVELFRIVQKDGLGGLWEHLRSLIAEGVSELFTKIKETILYETIKKVLAYIATLFNPVGAFIQAALALYHGIQFLIGNIDRLEKLVNAFLDSLELAVKGDVSSIADKVVFALRNAIVLAIDFLAKLLNLGNLVEKARSIIQTIRKPIIKAMGWVVDKFKPLINKAMKGGKALIAKGKKVVGGAVNKLKGWLGIKKSVPAENGEHHEVYFKGEEDRAQLIIASNDPKEYTTWVSSIKIDGSTDAGKKRLLLQGKAKTKAGEIDALKAKKISAQLTEEDKASQLDTLMSELAKLTGPLFAGNRPDWEEPAFGGLHAGLYGTRMTATQLAKNKMPAGSVPSLSHDSFATINQRRNQGGSYYILGHLLNQKLGGTGSQWENLTPLTRSANSQHEVDVEKLVKQVVTDGNVVKYSVKPVYGRSSSTKGLENAVDGATLNEEPDTIKAIIRQEVHVPTALDCEASMINPDTQQEVSLLKTTVTNTVDQSPAAYDLVGKKREPIYLQTDPAKRIATIGSGVDLELASKIKAAFTQKAKMDQSRFSSYEGLRDFQLNGKPFFTGSEKNVLKKIETFSFVKLY